MRKMPWLPKRMQKKVADSSSDSSFPFMMTKHADDGVPRRRSPRLQSTDAPFKSSAANPFSEATSKVHVEKQDEPSKSNAKRQKIEKIDKNAQPGAINGKKFVATFSRNLGDSIVQRKKLVAEAMGGAINKHHLQVVKMLEKEEQARKDSCAKFVETIQLIKAKAAKDSSAAHEQTQRIQKVLEYQVKFDEMLRAREASRDEMLTQAVNDLVNEFESSTGNQINSYLEAAKGMQIDLDDAMDKLHEENAAKMIENMRESLQF